MEIDQDLWFDARHQYVGDSMWGFYVLFDALRFNDVTVVANAANKGVFEFFRDYGAGMERLHVVTESGDRKTIQLEGGPWNREVQFILRKPLEPIVDAGPYICFQPDARSHNKRSTKMRSLNCRGRGYSIGLSGESIVEGTLAFQSRSFSDVARLLYHSVGIVAVFSSMSLFASLLGKKVVYAGWDAMEFNAGGGEHTGFPSSRCLQVCASQNLAEAVNKHFEEIWVL